MLAVVAGCFSELPTPPSGDTQETGASASTTSAGSTDTSVPTGSTGQSPTAANDGDSTAPTMDEPPPQGLFACDPLACPRWDCSQGCSMAGPEGVCVLKALRDRTTGGVEIETCKDGVCRVRHVAIRGGGTEDATHQWHDHADPPQYSETWVCELGPSEFFTACLTQFTPECADPDQWVANCAMGPASC